MKLQPVTPPPRAAKFSLTRSVVVSLLIGLLMFALAIISVMQVRMQILNSFMDLRETRDFELASNLVLQPTIDLEAAYRGYVATGAEGMLAPVASLQRDLQAQLQTLSRLVQQEAGFAGAVDGIATLAREALTELEEATNAARQGNPDRAQQMSRVLSIKARVDALRQAIGDFQMRLHEQLAERRQRMDGIISLLLTAIIVLLMGIAVSALALVKELGRKAAEAIEAGRQTADTISSLTTHLDLSRLETNLVNKRLAVAIQSAKTAVFTIDSDGRIPWMSASPESPLAGADGGTSLETRVAPVFRPEFRRRLGQCFAGQEAVSFDLALDTEPNSPANSERWMRFNLVPPGPEGGSALGSAIDITDIRQREAANFLLMRELSHRSKNLLAIVQAMARQTAQRAGSLEAFKERFGERLRALAASHDLLVRHNYSGAEIRDVIRSQLGDRAGQIGTRITLEGRGVFLQPVAAQTFGMAIHELASNARLFGALSNETGTVHVQWQDGQENDRQVFIVDWQEHGAPIQSGPTEPGFGTMLIATNLPRALNGHVELTHHPEGTRCRMVLDLSMVEERASQDMLGSL